ncbi:rifin PIR protein, putative [Plasmodium reichenowi]|uniref:Rifin PIR protein, putative n=1 Tax=Plasmodium reichenowi TaxID=5854 RepID=A0A2P9DE61_PLARE|nr:rifin PIR protein, putative [Plasmodium reichenowi]
MKLYYSKILLFFFPLNILLTSYHAHNNNNNELYVTPHHTPIYTSRVLSECDTQSSNYDKDADMKSVKQQFDDRTSQRFEEYDERMKDKRQKSKEERDKNIQKIIEKDKMEKSLAEKVEKGCLRCGCALGGGVLPVWGLVSGLWYATLSQHVTKLAIQKGIEEGIKEGIKQIVQIFQKSSCGAVPKFTVEEMLSSGKFTKSVDLFDMVQRINTMSDNFPDPMYYQFWSRIHDMVTEGDIVEFNVNNSANIAEVAKAVTKGEEVAIAAEHAKYTHLYSAIGYSFLAILIIVLVMIIIYLVLRYRRKNKMNKKAQYTKLLNQ